MSLVVTYFSFDIQNRQALTLDRLGDESTGDQLIWVQYQTVPRLVDQVSHRIIWLGLANDVDVVSWLQRRVLPLVFKYNAVLVAFVILCVKFLYNLIRKAKKLS